VGKDIKAGKHTLSVKPFGKFYFSTYKVTDAKTFAWKSVNVDKTTKKVVLKKGQYIKIDKWATLK
jgi:hypothetical protein